MSLILVASSHAGHAIKIIVVILAGPADKEILLLVDQVPARVFTLFEVRNQLDRIGRTGFLAHATIDAARKVNPEEFRIAAIVGLWTVRSLKRDTIDRASRRAEVTGDAALFSIRIPGENDSSTPTWR